MTDFEKLGVFYLGKQYNLSEKKIEEPLILYDSKDLCTHAVCVGMTGSGKTGLCVGLLEEAAIDGIPAIIIDPKGDLSNLLLMFDNLSPEEFQPWINEQEAVKKSISPEEFAKKQSELWKKGIRQWGQDEGRIKKLKDMVEMEIYTPGSSAGKQISLLISFDLPSDKILNDRELLNEHISMTITGLLNLLKIDSDPIQSKEHIFLSKMLQSLWQNGRSVSLSEFISAIQNPPFEKLGVFDLETFYPSKERFALSLQLNNLLASPGFSHWREGEPLDIDSLYYTDEGKPKVSILSIAHLNDSDRMFFVTMFLTELLAWSRNQTGTNSLRALFYMDEIFGYFPPVANPPSKQPLLNLLKQARAFGLGIVLASQNPVDLDYKGLSNAGTWFIGRLQTDNDKERMLDGLAGIQGNANVVFNRSEMSKLLSSLGKRVFLMNNVHNDSPKIFHTRWVLSYLRGPLSRDQIKILMADKIKTTKKNSGTEVINKVLKARKSKTVSVKPVIGPDIDEYILSHDLVNLESENIKYSPYLLSAASVYYADAKLGLATERQLHFITPFPDSGKRIRWEDAKNLPVDISDLDSKFIDDEPVSFSSIPKAAIDKKKYKLWGKEFKEWIYRNTAIELLRSESLGEVSQPDETEREFRIRMQLVAHEKRDLLIDKIRKRYTPKIQRLEERLLKAEQKVEVQAEQEKQSKLHSAISFGSTILSAVLGKKLYGLGTLSRASTSAKSISKIYKEKNDVKRSQENRHKVQQRLEELEIRLQDEIDFIENSISPQTEELKSYKIKPLKKNISAKIAALIWLPNPEEYLE